MLGAQSNAQNIDGTVGYKGDPQVHKGSRKVTHTKKK